MISLMETDPTIAFMQQVSRAFGNVSVKRFSDRTIDDFDKIGCAVALVSSRYALSDGCGVDAQNPLLFRAMRVEMGGRPGANDSSVFAPTKYLRLLRTPVATGNGWAVLKIAEDASEFGSVRLTPGLPVVGEELFVVTAPDKRPTTECRVVELIEKGFLFKCPGWQVPPHGTAMFLFSKKDGSLIGLHHGEVPVGIEFLGETFYPAFAYALATAEILKQSKTLAGIPPMPPASLDATVPETLGRKAKKILDCYSKQISGDKVATIQQVYECSGFWITPRALMVCSLGASCPALPDTVEGRAVLKAALEAEEISINSPLEFRANTIPRLPDSENLKNCKSNTSSEQEFTYCAASAISNHYKALFDCLGKFTDGEKLACFAKQVDNKDFTALIGCLAGGRPTPDKIAFCTAKPGLETQISDIRSCIANSFSGGDARSCIATMLPPAQQDIITCLNTSTGVSDPAACLDAISPEVNKARVVTACLEIKDQASAIRCVAPHIAGDAQKIASCLAKPDRNAAEICLLGDTPQVRAIQQVNKCIKGGRDASSVIASCTDGILDDKSRQTIACVAGSRSDRARLAGCAAGVVLPPEATRLVGCASSSEGPTSFALCAAGPEMNEEWRIAAECAVQSGGEPISFASCTAGRLTVRELTKCFAGEVGKDCFGPNNTIVVAFSKAFSDVTKGPGKNNEIRKAIRAVGDLTGGPNSVINNPGQIGGGSNSVFKNPDQILGGDHSVFHDPGQVLSPSRWRF